MTDKDLAVADQLAAAPGVTVELVNPITGELVPYGDVPALAEAVRVVKERRDHLNDVIAAFNHAIIQESTRQGTRTLNIGRTTVKVSADHETEWDIELLQEGLLAAGIPQERLEELVVAKVEYKVNGTVARQLSGANPEYKTAIEAAKGRVPKKQYVTATDA